MISKAEVEEKIQEIYTILSDAPTDLPLGLFSGQVGISLFLYNYYKHTKDEEAFLAFQNSLNFLIEDIHSFDNLLFANGLSGLAWFLNYLYKEDAVSNEILDILDSLDNFIESNLDIDYEISDFMHGSLGCALYFIQRDKFEMAESILETLFENSVEKDNLDWISKMYNEDNSSDEIINLSLAHGSAAVIVILSKFLSRLPKDGDHIFRGNLINLISYFQRLKSEGPMDKYPGHCCFNLNGEKENVYSRLSWCYGEMGIGLAFWQVGCLLEEACYKEEAIEIYKSTLDRTSMEEVGIHDACICHGTAGLAHMYNRMYYNTKRPEFRDAANNWIEQTLNFAKFEDGLAGYKSWYQPNWITEYNLLGGISGVGLSLLSHLDEECASWDECLLLN